MAEQRNKQKLPPFRDGENTRSAPAAANMLTRNTCFSLNLRATNRVDCLRDIIQIPTYAKKFPIAPCVVKSSIRNTPKNVI